MIEIVEENLFRSTCLHPCPLKSLSSSELSDQKSDKVRLDLDSLIHPSMSDSKEDDLSDVSGVA